MIKTVRGKMFSPWAEAQFVVIYLCTPHATHRMKVLNRRSMRMERRSMVIATTRAFNWLCSNRRLPQPATLEQPLSRFGLSFDTTACTVSGAHSAKPSTLSNDDCAMEK
jgi:hypothetical protein